MPLPLPAGCFVDLHRDAWDLGSYLLGLYFVKAPPQSPASALCPEPGSIGDFPFSRGELNPEPHDKQLGRQGCLRSLSSYSNSRRPASSKQGLCSPGPP